MWGTPDESSVRVAVSVLEQLEGKPKIVEDLRFRTLKFVL